VEEDIIPVECLVTEVFPISHLQHLPPKITCVSITGSNRISYACQGNTGEFFSGCDYSGGQVKLTVPRSAISGNIITFTADTMDDMIINCQHVDEEERRKLQLTHHSSTIGQKKVLVVRVSNDNVTARSVQQSALQLIDDIFNDENNAKEVYRACSNDRLELIPSPSPDYPNGVLQINAPWNICNNRNWLVVWDDLISTNSILSSAINNANIDFIMAVMPNCVDWENAAGWGQTPGKITWFPSEYASLPVTQVHELGHNFGHHHSGKGGIPYADDTGYMGNTALWSDVGSKMCFNPAKTWHFGWFSNHHQVVTVSSSSFTGTLVGASNEDIASLNDKIVIKIVAEGTGNKDLYIMYNGATGANQEVRGSRNQIVITEQASNNGVSSWMAGLSNAPNTQSWSKSWGSGNTLVVKNCGIVWGSPGSPTRATIVIAHSGASALNCATPSNNQNSVVDETPDDVSTQTGSSGVTPSIFYDTQFSVNPIEAPHNGITTETSILEPPLSSSTTTTCRDIPDWHDSDGEKFNCEWYGNIETRCQHGNKHPNQGHSSKTACCICGGGRII